MDIIGPLPMAPSQKCFMLALMFYYHKWMTTETYANVKDEDVRMFVRKYIICQFRIPKKIVVDNGSQFISNEFQEFCKY